MGRPRSFSTEDVVDAAIEQFRSSSFSATSTDQLCDCTGLSRSSLYNAFRSKSEIFAAALSRYDETQTADRAHHLDDDDTGREILERLLRETIAIQFRTDDHRTCMVLAASVELGRSDEQIAELARHNLAAFADTITRIIERGQCDGTLRSDLAAGDLARMLHAMLNGLQIVGRVSEDDVAIQATIDTALQLLRPTTDQR
ncbi:TetR/AcrR family transcriptional regulator [Microlunatus soli]|uniref:DNA-binding transcriptional regulator, AcrR family n=1 Tax=Microlunatus soli TaxID=630515 RepID=A0A1H1SWH4_9ACTN|nr:TetR/AcrR family transcriptional regulator [Microlunatus soli]SDS52294.1 DNA-binding transcriptional regulator, AcrR family [Microlunatus soli]